MKLIEVLAALLIFSIFVLGVMSQFDAETRVCLRLIEIMDKLDAEILSSF